MSSAFTYRMGSYPASLQACLRALEESEVYEQMPPHLRFTAELILDELASNTIKYGGLDCREILFQLEFDGENMRVVVSDDAKPFNPWEEAPGINDEDVENIEDIPIGGRGIEMLRQATDFRHYERKDGRNINILMRGGGGRRQNAAA